LPLLCGGLVAIEAGWIVSQIEKFWKSNIHINSRAVCVDSSEDAYAFVVITVGVDVDT
jgi:hypothetical protein